MATLKQRLHRKNSSGSYDTVHLETTADLVLMSDGTKLSNKISAMDASITALSTGSIGSMSGGNGTISGALSVGNTVTFDNLTWLVVDDGTYNSNECVLIIKDIWCKVLPVDIYQFATYFWNYVLSAKARDKCTRHKFKEYGGNAYTIPCWVATSTEVSQFSYFTGADANAHRAAKYENDNYSWWTSTDCSSGIPYYAIVAASGGVQYSGTSCYSANPYGFRPCIALKK